MNKYTIQFESSCRPALESGITLLESGDFEQSSEYLERAVGCLDALRVRERVIGNPEQANAYWIAQNYICAWNWVARFWESAIRGKFDSAWFYLQRGCTTVHQLKSVAECDDRIDWMYSQLRYWDHAFDYRWFFSIEAKISQAICTICHQDVRSSQCTHIKGWLYNGELAGTVLRQGKIIGVSLVKDPANRHCVAKVEGVVYSHQGIQKMIACVSSPFQTARFLLPASSGRNDPCPCGSGNKMKRCCLGVWYTDSTQPHLDVTGTRYRAADFC